MWARALRQPQTAPKRFLVLAVTRNWPWALSRATLRMLSASSARREIPMLPPSLSLSGVGRSRVNTRRPRSRRELSSPQAAATRAALPKAGESATRGLAPQSNRCAHTARTTSGWVQESVALFLDTRFGLTSTCSPRAKSRPQAVSTRSTASRRAVRS